MRMAKAWTPAVGTTSGRSRTTSAVPPGGIGAAASANAYAPSSSPPTRTSSAGSPPALRTVTRTERPDAAGCSVPATSKRAWRGEEAAGEETAARTIRTVAALLRLDRDKGHAGGIEPVRELLALLLVRRVDGDVGAPRGVLLDGREVAG